MNKSKNQNSILVLATLGVYFGLVLAGATPHVLAQAAMTRQFDVKDEVEVKDDLDKKPNNFSADSANATGSETDRNIARSVEQFLAGFDTTTLFCNVADPISKRNTEHWQASSALIDNDYASHQPISNILTVTNLPRAALDPLLTSNAR